MAARIDYLVKTKNRCVVAYTSDAVGSVSFDIGPSAFGANLSSVGAENYPVATKGLTYTSAAISRIVGSCSGTEGDIEFKFLGATSYTAFVLPHATFMDKNLERVTIPNFAQGSTGMAQITNNIPDSPQVTLMIEFVTRHVS